MANKAHKDRVGALVKDVETIAKRIRADVRKRTEAGGLLKNLQRAADLMRKRAAKAAGQVEKYVHMIRTELEGTKPTKRARPKKRKAVNAVHSAAAH